MRIFLLAALALAPATALAAPPLRTIYAFQGDTDGAYPQGTPVADRAGNLYGVTAEGGPGNSGTIYELSPPAPGQTQWTETQLFAFGQKIIHGSVPAAGLLRAPPNDLYGTASGGGEHGCGTVFRLRHVGSQWVFHPLYQFGTNPQDGCWPEGKLAEGRDGSLYGTTESGGQYGNGAVFRLAPPAAGATGWSEAVIWSFNNGNFPNSTPVLDAGGNVYGTLQDQGGGYGTVWKLSPPAAGGTAWTGQTIWSFTGNADGSYPNPAIAMDSAGRIWGTCELHGVSNGGTAWVLTPSGGGGTGYSETNLYQFSMGSPYSFPAAGIEFAAHGTLIGTLFGTGSNREGFVYTLHPPASGQTAWTFQVLWPFTGPDGKFPDSLPFRETPGTFFGTTSEGGLANRGTVYELTK